MVSVLHKLGWRAEALAWDGYQSLFRSMGLEKASDFGANLIKKLGPLTSAQHVARTNMQILFPDAHEREIDDLLVRMWDNFGRLLGEFPNTHCFDMSENSEQIEFENLDYLKELARSDQPTVFIGGHFANWELMPAAIVHHMPTCRITYRHANNPYIDKRIISQRAAYGVEVFAPKGGDGAKEIMKALKAGYSVALMNDQKMNDGIAAPFAGREAMTASGPTRLALRQGARLVPMSIRRIEGPRFRIKIHDPLETPEGSGPDEILQVVTKINQFMEDRIKEAPAQWFWVHRRFDKSVYRKTSG